MTRPAFGLADTVRARDSGRTATITGCRTFLHRPPTYWLNASDAEYPESELELVTRHPKNERTDTE